MKTLNEIIDEIKDWSAMYGCQIMDYENIINSHVLRKFSRYVPLNIIYVINTMEEKNNINIPKYTYSEDNDYSEITYYPKSVGKIYTAVDENNLPDPSIVSVAPYASRMVYAKLNTDFMVRFNYENKLMFVPEVPDDVDKIYIEFIFDWKNISQFPDSFESAIVACAKWAILESLYNQTMFSDVVTNKYVQSEDNRRIFLGLESQTKNIKNEFIDEINELNKIYHGFK